MKALTMAALAALTTLAAAQTRADQTNLVQSVRIQLEGVTQGGTFSNSNGTVTAANYANIDTHRVIAALGAATGNNFSFASRLVLVTPLDGSPASLQVRDGANNIDVTGFLTLQPLSDSVQSSMSNNRSGRSFVTVFDIMEFALQDADGYPSLNLHFDVKGFATRTTTNQGSDLSINVAGAGDRSGTLVVLQGNIDIRGNSLEVVSGGGVGVN